MLEGRHLLGGSQPEISFPEECKHHSAYMTIIALPPSPPPVALKDTNSKRHTSEGKLGFVQVLKTQCEKFILRVVYEAWAYVLPWAPVLLELLISRLCPCLFHLLVLQALRGS